MSQCGHKLCLTNLSHLAPLTPVDRLCSDPNHDVCIAYKCCLWNAYRTVLRVSCSPCASNSLVLRVWCYLQAPSLLHNLPGAHLTYARLVKQCSMTHDVGRSATDSLHDIEMPHCIIHSLARSTAGVAENEVFGWTCCHGCNSSRGGIWH